MPEVSLLLRVRWIHDGPATMPTILAFTGFGHRLDPWQRLRAPGWRLGVIEFPVGNPPSDVWNPVELTRQLSRLWQHASQRVLMGFSFGCAGATVVSKVLQDKQNDPEFLNPHLSIHIAPVQWARIPWSVIKRIPQRMRLRSLKQLAKGSGALMAFAGRAGEYGVRDFVQIVDKHVGWDFVAFYLPYLDWIQGTRTTLNIWEACSWPHYLVGAQQDRVIPTKLIKADERYFGQTQYDDFEAAHFNAVDAARTHIYQLLAKQLLQVNT